MDDETTPITHEHELVRAIIAALRDGEARLVAARRRLERLIALDDRELALHDPGNDPPEDWPTDAELEDFTRAERARLESKAPPCPDCQGRSGSKVADVVTGLCYECRIDRLRIEFEHRELARPGDDEALVGREALAC